MLSATTKVIEQNGWGQIRPYTKKEKMECGQDRADGMGGGGSSSGGSSSSSSGSGGSSHDSCPGNPNTGCCKRNSDRHELNEMVTVPDSLVPSYRSVVRGWNL